MKPLIMISLARLHPEYSYSLLWLSTVQWPTAVTRLRGWILHQSLQLSAFHCVKKKFSQNKKPGASCRILEPLTGRLQWGFLNQPKISISFQKIKDTRSLENGFSFPESCFYTHSNPYTKGVFTTFLWDLATAALLVSTKVIKRLYKRARKRKAWSVD